MADQRQHEGQLFLFLKSSGSDKGCANFYEGPCLVKVQEHFDFLRNILHLRWPNIWVPQMADGRIQGVNGSGWVCRTYHKSANFLFSIRFCFVMFKPFLRYQSDILISKLNSLSSVLDGKQTHIAFHYCGYHNSWCAPVNRAFWVLGFSLMIWQPPLFWYPARHFLRSSRLGWGSFSIMFLPWCFWPLKHLCMKLTLPNWRHSSQKTRLRQRVTRILQRGNKAAAAISLFNWSFPWRCGWENSRQCTRGAYF